MGCLSVETMILCETGVVSEDETLLSSACIWRPIAWWTSPGHHEFDGYTGGVPMFL